MSLTPGGRDIGMVHIELAELKRRTEDLDARLRRLDADHAALQLQQQRGELARGNRLRRRIATFAERAAGSDAAIPGPARGRLIMRPGARLDSDVVTDSVSAAWRRSG